MTWPIITTDSHHMVPLELADELPERYRDYVPHLEARTDGHYLVRPQSNQTVRRSGGGAMTMDTRTAALAGGVKVDPDDAAALRRTLYGNCPPTATPGA